MTLVFEGTVCSQGRALSGGIARRVFSRFRKFQSSSVLIGRPPESQIKECASLRELVAYLGKKASGNVKPAQTAAGFVVFKVARFPNSQGWKVSVLEGLINRSFVARGFGTVANAVSFLSPGSLSPTPYLNPKKPSLSRSTYKGVRNYTYKCIYISVCTYISRGKPDSRLEDRRLPTCFQAAVFASYLSKLRKQPSSSSVVFYENHYKPRLIKHDHPPCDIRASDVADRSRSSHTGTATITSRTPNAGNHSG